MNKKYTAESIERLEGLQKIYYRAGMYIGSTTNAGMQHCVNEVLDNSVDEYTVGVCNKITVSLHKDGSITVLDNGRGIPVGINPKYGMESATMAVTEIHAGGKFGGENSSYQNTGGMNGVGLAAVNATSLYFEMTIWRDGKVYFQRFEQKFNDVTQKVMPAIPVADLKQIDTCPIEQTGTQIKFKLDPKLFMYREVDEETGKEIIEEYQLSPILIQERLHALSCLNPKLKLIFIDEINDKQFEWFDNSLKTYIDYVRKDESEQESLQDMIEFKHQLVLKVDEKHPIDIVVALQWFKDNFSEVRSFVNNIPTPNNGEHVKGLMLGVENALTNYVKIAGSDKEKKDYAKINKNDLLEGMTGLVSIKINAPVFKSQTKEELTDKRAFKAVKNTVETYLGKYFEENPNIAKDIIQRTLRAKKAREAAEKARKDSLIQKTVTKLQTPSKLVDCQSNNPELNEIYLVEGDSAGGSAKAGRDKKYQAVLPLKGKIPNTFNVNMSEIAKNEEIKNMISSFGCGVGKEFNLNKLRYHKIVIMTDADEDGKHIAVLLITFFHRFFPELLKNGYIYVAIAPLFSLKKKKGNHPPIYLHSNQELLSFQKSHNMELWTVSRFKGLGEMNADQLSETTMNPETRKLGQIQYIENYDGQVANILDVVMGNDADKRKHFMYHYPINPELFDNPI